MKSFDTLTKQELVDLSEDEIKGYLDYICAEEGLPLEIKKPERPAALAHNLDLELTEIPAVVIPREVGDQLMAIINASLQYSKTYKNDHFDLIKEDGYSKCEAKQINGASAESEAKLAVENYSLTVQWKEYNDEEEAFTTACEARLERIQSLYEQISDARVLLARRERMLGEWNRYLDLAENDRSVAERFFVDRYSQQECDDLFSEEQEDG